MGNINYFPGTIINNIDSIVYREDPEQTLTILVNAKNNKISIGVSFYSNRNQRQCNFSYSYKTLPHKYTETCNKLLNLYRKEFKNAKCELLVNFEELCQKYNLI